MKLFLTTLVFAYSAQAFDATVKTRSEGNIAVGGITRDRLDDDAACGTVGFTPSSILELTDQPSTFTVIVDENGEPDHYYSFNGTLGVVNVYTFSTCGLTTVKTSMAYYYYNTDNGTTEILDSCFGGPSSCGDQTSVVYENGNNIPLLFRPGTLDGGPGTYEVEWTVRTSAGTCGVPNPDASILELEEQPNPFPVVIDDFGDPDFGYSFTGPVGTAFAFSTCGLTSVDTSMTIVDLPQQNFFACEDQSCESQTELSFTVFDFPVPFLFRAGTYLGQGPTSYEVAWKKCPPPSPENCEACLTKCSGIVGCTDACRAASGDLTQEEVAMCGQYCKSRAANRALKCVKKCSYECGQTAACRF